MSAVDLEATVLSDLDFTSTLPCEHSQHASWHAPDGPARWLVACSTTPCCGTPVTDYLICDAGRALMLRHGFVTCVDCWAVVPVRPNLHFLPIGSDR